MFEVGKKLDSIWFKLLLRILHCICGGPKFDYLLQPSLSWSCVLGILLLHHWMCHVVGVSTLGYLLCNFTSKWVLCMLFILKIMKKKG